MPYDIAAFARAGTTVPTPLPPARHEQIDLFASDAAPLPDPLDLAEEGALVVHNKRTARRC